jgi:AcrR family transcriptional regulator
LIKGQKSLRDPEGSKQRLLEAGLKVFSERGYDGGSVSMIVKAAGLNRRMLYHYFGSKEGLYRTCIRQVYSQLQSIEVKLADIALPADELIEHLIRAYYQFLKTHPTYVRIMTWENLRGGKSAEQAEISNVKAPIIEALHIALEKGRRQGQFRTDIDEKQILLSCMAHSYFYFANQYTVRLATGYDLSDDKVLEDHLKYVVSLLVDGIRIRSKDNTSEESNQ